MNNNKLNVFKAAMGPSSLQGAASYEVNMNSTLTNLLTNTNLCFGKCMKR